MRPYIGPSFRLVEEVSFDAVEFGAGVAARDAPLLVKGAVRHWPAWEKWSFGNLAHMCEADTSAHRASFQTGLTEQGATRQRVNRDVSPYLRELAAARRPDPARALLHPERRAELQAGERFHLDWSRMDFTPDRTYLQQWDMLAHLPQLRGDFPMRRLWPGLRKTWEYAFIGPADTLSGLHCDFPNNWFCQVRGAKEFVLFTRDQTPHLSVARKYDWGATLSEVDISRLGEEGEVRDRFGKAHGIYARVEAGDALFIPKRTWHAVVALEPSISIGIFGLTPLEIVVGGGAATLKDALHHARLYRWGNCTCHPHREARTTT